MVKNMTATITDNIVDAVKVQFLKPIFEDDFPDKGMVAWLVDVTWEDEVDCYKLWFDFTEFDAQNDKYFKADYRPNRHTAALQDATGRMEFTAKEAGMYTPKYSVYFSTNLERRSTEDFEREIQNYLRVVE